MAARASGPSAASLFAVLGLWAVAVAQPLLDLLGQNPEFFVAHRAGAVEILFVTLALTVALPGILAALAWLGGRFATLGIVAVLSALVGLQILKRFGVHSAALAFPSAAAVGVAAAVAYDRLRVVRAFAAALALAALAVPLVFLARPRIWDLVSPPAPAESFGGAAVGASASHPVVILILDETPLLSLLDGEAKIDGAHYPNLARLARDGVLFRNATTVSDYTSFAVPAIVSGVYPRPKTSPTHADHPRTLFTLLARTHRVEALEAMTRLCPDDVCRPVSDPLGARLGAMASDLGVVFQHVVLTDDLRTRLPPLSDGWAGFGDAEADEADARQARRARRARGRRPDKLQVAMSAADWISRDDRQPTFYFVHTLLPHSPWLWLPTGQRNATRTPLAGDEKWRWTNDEWGVLQYQQRHLLQIGAADRVVGRLLSNLETAGLYQDALVIVTADHGISFRPGAPRRTFSRETAPEIMRVPLIIKFPAGRPLPLDLVRQATDGQRVSDRNVETVDIAPTVADVLGIAVPWQTNGVSLLGPPQSGGRDGKRIFFADAQRSVKYPAAGPDLGPALKQKLAAFGNSDNPYRVPRAARYAELLGRPVRDLTISDGGGKIEVDSLSAFQAVDTRAEAVPFDVSGRLAKPAPAGDPVFVAVAVNGVVQAVTRTFESDRRRWLATPPLDAWRQGQNQLEVFVLGGQGDGVVLRRATVTAPGARR